MKKIEKFLNCFQKLFYYDVYHKNTYFLKKKIYHYLKKYVSVKKFPLEKILSDLFLDLKAFYENDPAAYDFFEIIFTYQGMFAILTYRIGHALYLLNVKYLPRMLSSYAHFRTSIDIHPACNIDAGFFIDHGTGVVIGETTSIGKNVKIYQGVTLGAKSLTKGHALKGQKRHPTIGNNVTIYANSSILGGDTIIGDNVIIGANCLILESVPNNYQISLDEIKLKKKNKAG